MFLLVEEFPGINGISMFLLVEAFPDITGVSMFLLVEAFPGIRKRIFILVKVGSNGNVAN